MVWTSVAIAMVVVAALVDGVVVASRIRHVDVALPTARAGSGVTYLILGSDSRAAVPAGATGKTARFGTVEDFPGSRADVVLVVNVAPDGTSSAVSIPRDLLVQDERGYPRRLALTLVTGPQATVDALCRSLGIATSHLVMIDFSGFAAVVDAAGGVDVELPHPTRDRISGLEVETEGRVHLDGLQALALVRSRHPEQLVDGRWVAMDDADGAAARTRWAGVVFHTLQAAAARARVNPVLLQRLAWTLSGALTTDSGTGVFDLLRLARTAGAPVDLPGDAPADSVLGVEITPATRAALAGAGLDSGCTPRA